MKPMKGSQIITPATLKKRCTTAARTASRGLPITASPAVAQVPMLAPKASAMPASRLMKPWLAMTMTMPVDADDDWMMAVNTSAMRTPTIGLSIVFIRSRKGSKVRSGAIASLITCMPKKTMPRPISMTAVVLGLVALGDEQHGEADGDHPQRRLGDLEGDDLGGDRRADVGAHDHADRLRQRHQPGRDEADDQHGRHRRRLDHRRHQRARADAHEAIDRQRREDALHALAGDGLEALLHLHHAEEEDGEAAEQFDGHHQPVGVSGSALRRQRRSRQQAQRRGERASRKRQCDRLPAVSTVRDSCCCLLL